MWTPRPHCWAPSVPPKAPLQADTTPQGLQGGFETGVGTAHRGPSHLWQEPESEAKPLVQSKTADPWAPNRLLGAWGERVYLPTLPGRGGPLLTALTL